MYEVFDYITGETVGYTDSLLRVLVLCAFDPRLDYIEADTTPADFCPAF